MKELTEAEVIALINEWTLEHGGDLVPSGSDTYGEGKRDAKKQVARIIQRLKRPA